LILSHKEKPYCLSPHLRVGAGLRVTTIHLHSDGSWWFWNPDGTIEQGPFDSRMLAEEAWKPVSSEMEKPAVDSDFKWALRGLLAFMICLLLPVGYRIVTLLLSR